MAAEHMGRPTSHNKRVFYDFYERRGRIDRVRLCNASDLIEYLILEVQIDRPACGIPRKYDSRDCEVPARVALPFAI
jgi:hypothetical protein